MHMDLFKVFDTINSDILIVKLNAYGFTKESYRLIKSYLSNKEQRLIQVSAVGRNYV